MCGVFGWATPRPLRGPAPERWLQRGLDRLDHRGPDGRGVWRGITPAGGEVALGHTRLSIIDVQGGAQPFVSHDGRFVVSFNGEIYNYLELAETLRAEGCRFTTRSDTEVLVEAYRVWGTGAFGRFRGMFAFALYDTVAGVLVLARDPFGKKPLFLAEVGGGVAFSSEIPPLLDLPGVERRLNGDGLGEYLLRRYVPGPRTLFTGVRKLPPGCFAVCEDGRFSEHRYFTPPLATMTPQPLGRAEAVERFSAELQSAVRMRLRADAPCGVYLSGGLDSSTIAALMAREGGAVRSFAAGFEEAAYSELAPAARMAERLCARHEALTVTASDFLDHWPEAVRSRAAPVSEASDIPILMLSRAAARSVKVVLTGEGADELLAGYPKHRAERWIGRYHRLFPAALHARLIDPLVRRLPYSARRAKVLSRALCYAEPEARSRIWFANADPDVVAALCPGAALEPMPAARSDLSSLRQVMLADQTNWLPDDLLERGDRMTMAAGIEARAPFMDVELAALVAGFPDRLLFDRRGGKAILRAAARDWLPADILNRRKVGFRTPVGDWFRGALRPMLRELLCDPASGVRRMLDAAAIDRLLAGHLERRSDHTDLLWTLANLELFLREFRLEAPV